MRTDIERIKDAWNTEGSLNRMSMRTVPDKDIQAALVPFGGDWTCGAESGAATRSIYWRRMEVALINPRGDFSDVAEGQIAMGMRATPIMDTALRVIFALAFDDADCSIVERAARLSLIAKVARAAIACVEQPAPPIPEPEEEGE